MGGTPLSLTPEPGGAADQPPKISGGTATLDTVITDG
jgi:hypothetical protein